jgi:cell division protein FtsW
MRRAAVKLPDYTFAGIVAVLLMFGLVMLSSAGSVLGFQRYDDSNYFLKKHLISLTIGLFAGYIAYRIDYRQWRKWSVPIFFLSLVLLVVVFFPGVGSYFLGARRWINLGFMVFQPSEFFKLAFIFYLAAWLEQRERVLSNLQEGLVPFLFTLGIGAGLIILQPDLGTTMVLVIIGIAMFFVGGGSVKHLLGLGVLGVLLLGVIIVAEPYRAQRLNVFINPDVDPQGIGYHVKQSKLAIGSGGLFGLGLGHSRQKFNYLPEPAGDSIFAVMAEELGFLFVVVFIAGWTALIWRGIGIANDAPDRFGKLVGTGIIVWLGIQAFLNIGALSGLLPLTGIPLPFMSHGGSAIIMNVIAIGVLLNISRSTKEGKTS